MQDCICSAFAMPIGNAVVVIFFNVVELLKGYRRFGLLRRVRISSGQLFF